MEQQVRRVTLVPRAQKDQLVRLVQRGRPDPRGLLALHLLLLGQPDQLASRALQALRA